MRKRLRVVFNPVFFSCAFSLLALSVPAAGAAAPVAVGAPVTITDSAVMPNTVVIPVGGSVLWTNGGTRSHEAVAFHAAFKSFSLPPANSKRVTFSRAGRYPYLVDGKTRGTVFVVVRYGAVEQPSGTGPHNCHPTILHYDIDVAVHTDDKRTDPRQQGMESSVIDWKAHWANAAMSVDRCHGGVTVLIPDVQQPWAIPDQDTNKLIAADTKTFDWTDTTQFGQEVVPPCHFTNVSTFRAGMFLQGKLYGSVGSDFQFLRRGARDRENRIALPIPVERLGMPEAAPA
jgi:plastocyanin